MISKASSSTAHGDESGCSTLSSQTSSQGSTVNEWQVIEDDDMTWYIIYDRRMKGAGFLDLEEAQGYVRRSADRGTEVEVEHLDGTRERVRV